jgi:hypothetical protein
MSSQIEELIANMIVDKYYGKPISIEIATKIASDIAKPLEESIVGKINEIL